MLKKFTLVLIVFAVVAMAAFVSCDKVKIPGNVAGTVMNESGAGQGFVTVALIDTETGNEAARETTNDLGGFIIKGVEPGTYKVVCYGMSGSGELPMAQEMSVTLGGGKTENIEVYLIR